MSNRTHSHNQSQAHHGPHNHTHGTMDPALLTTERGIWAVKWSLIGLGATALFQLIIVFFSGSVALLADTIHNIADAGTAIPLWIAFAGTAAAFAPLHLRSGSRRRCGGRFHRPDDPIQRGSGRV